jgi:adenylosuccinate synthase
LTGAYVVAGLGFGDEGKGRTVDAICRRAAVAPLVVRYCGGAQAAHHVVTDTGESHCFAQFGAGTLAGSATHLGPAMIIEPLAAMANEAAHLTTLLGHDPYQRLTVNRECIVATPYHRRMNVARELDRGHAAHGSCGMGIGEARMDALDGDCLLADDLLDPATIRYKLLRIRDKKVADAEGLHMPVGAPTAVQTLLDLDVDQLVGAYASARVRDCLVDHRWLRDYLRRESLVVLEGAQGVLLDERVGFHPYTTWSDVTFSEARRLLTAADWREPVSTVGVLRAFGTRHGPGPFPTESPALRPCLDGDHNAYNRWQGAFRVGHFDLRLAEYAVSVLGGVGSLALTHMDCFAVPWWVADGYSGDPDLTPGDLCRQAELTRLLLAARPTYRTITSVGAFIDLLEDRLATSVRLMTKGPAPGDVLWRW